MHLFYSVCTGSWFRIIPLIIYVLFSLLYFTIPTVMPGRTDNDVKNRWYTKNNSIQKKLMKNKRKANSTPDNNNSTTKSNGGKSSSGFSA